MGGFITSKMFQALCCGLFLLSQLITIESVATKQDKDANAIGIAKLTLDMEKCFRGTGQNTFYSAMSLSSAMAMLFEGARGNTASQISKGLSFSNIPVKDVQQFYAETLTIKTNYTLELVNRLFAQTGFSVLQPYLDVLSQHFLAPLERLDFRKNPIEAAEAINNFVNNFTRGLIPELFQKDAFVGADPKLLILNAIYFRGFWIYKFNVSQTTTEDFTATNSKTAPTKFMNQIAKFKYSSLPNLESSAIQLDYEGGDISMTIILPDQVNGIENLLNKITAEDLFKFTENTTFSKRLVELKLPKFKLETTYEDELSVCLGNLGITDVFNPLKSNLSGIATTPLSVDKVIQKAVIDVDEEGTKAAAVTIICLSCRISTPRPIKFHADHPFFFFISHNKINAILFSGTYMNPV